MLFRSSMARVIPGVFRGGGDLREDLGALVQGTFRIAKRVPGEANEDRDVPLGGFLDTCEKLALDAAGFGRVVESGFDRGVAGHGAEIESTSVDERPEWLADEVDVLVAELRRAQE